jgi:hypothetical protein
MRSVVWPFALAALSACQGGKYVAAVYQDTSGALYVKLCDFDSSGKAEPDDCRIEPVQPLPGR